MPHSPPAKYGWLGVLVIAFTAASCARQSPTNDANVSQPAEPVPDTASEKESALPAPPLNRERLLVSFMEAAGAAITGTDDQETQRTLKGKRFELRMRFGCPDAPPSLDRSWTYDAKAGALKVAVKPDIDEEVDVEAAAPETGSASGNSAAEKPSKERHGGFLIPAPTVFMAGCPTPDFAAVPGFTNLRFGLIQTTQPDQPRAQQLLDNYEIVKKIAPDSVPTNGLDLIVRGRFVAGTQERAIVCKPRGGVVECLANVTLDKVSLENPANSVLIAEWGAN